MNTLLWWKTLSGTPSINIKHLIESFTICSVYMEVLTNQIREIQEFNSTGV